MTSALRVPAGQLSPRWSSDKAGRVLGRSCPRLSAPSAPSAPPSCDAPLSDIRSVLGRPATEKRKFIQRCLRRAKVHRGHTCLCFDCLQPNLAVWLCFVSVLSQRRKVTQTGHVSIHKPNQTALGLAAGPPENQLKPQLFHKNASSSQAEC